MWERDIPSMGSNEGVVSSSSSPTWDISPSQIGLEEVVMKEQPLLSCNHDKEISLSLLPRSFCLSHLRGRYLSHKTKGRSVFSFLSPSSNHMWERSHSYMGKEETTKKVRPLLPLSFFRSSVRGRALSCGTRGTSDHSFLQYHMRGIIIRVS